MGIYDELLFSVSAHIDFQPSTTTLCPLNGARFSTQRPSSASYKTHFKEQWSKTILLSTNNAKTKPTLYTPSAPRKGTINLMLNKGKAQACQARFYCNKGSFPPSPTWPLNKSLSNDHCTNLASNSHINCILLIINRNEIIISTLSKINPFSAMGSKPSKPASQQPIALTHTHPSAPQITSNRAYNFSRPRPRLNLDKPLPPLPIVVAKHGMVGRRAGGDERKSGMGRKGGYWRL